MGRAVSVETSVRNDIEELGDLVGIEPSLAATAYCLAKAIDGGGGEDGRMLPALVRELRMILKQLTEGRTGGEDDDDSDLGSAG